MAAGSVIHAMKDEQDMRKFGGLWRDMRPTAITFLVGSLSLVGVIPFVGFFSKEQILGAAFSKPDDTTVQFLWLVGFITALITGFYTGRMWWLSFWGKPSPQRPVDHPHAPPLVMMVPVAILAVLATAGGLLQTRALGFGPAAVSDFLDRVVTSQGWEGGGPEVAVTLLTMVLAAALFAGALRIKPWTAYAPWAQRLLEHKYYFDEIYDAVFVRPLDRIAGFALRDLERPVIDAAVVDTGQLTRWSAGELSLTQSGYFRNYVLAFVVGVVAIGGVLLVVRALA
jgi:NADH-quinone oxidoreductase subunit L